jgi:RND family efflux transporter MFP subunit
MGDAAMPIPPARSPRAALLPFVMAVACAPTGDEPVAPAPDDAPPVAVALGEAVEETWERTLRVTGELLALEDSTLAAKVPGRLESLAVDLGSVVSRGDMLAQIERRDYELRVRAAEAALGAARALLGLASDGTEDGASAVVAEETALVREARAELDQARLARDRENELLGSGIASRATYDDADAELRAAEGRWQQALEEIESRRQVLAEREADLALARALLEDTAIRAPFDGAVAERLADPGDFLQVGTSVVRLVRLDPLRVRLDVPERAANELRPGELVRVEVEGHPEGLAGPLVRLSPEIGALDRLLRVEAELANPDGALRPGAFARGEIVVDPEARALVVPADALVRFAGIDKVFRVEDGRAVETRVVVGRVASDRVEILDGLAAGAQVVRAPGGLRGGARVVPREE